MIFLLDQNVPMAVKAWLVEKFSEQVVYHTNDLGLSTALDREIYQWVSQHQAVIITFDYDFVEEFASRQRVGIIHLRANPTNRDNAVECLSHLFGVLEADDCSRALVLVKGNRVRVFAFP